MRFAYFDCFSGAAGDMILGGLVHAGLQLSVLHDVIARLELPGVELAVARAARGGIAATHVEVKIGEAARQRHRHLPYILAMIRGAGLPRAAASNAVRVFERLAGAEALVHGVSVEQVHFHEVGAADAIVDVVGACVGLDALGVDVVVCSPIPTGHGTVTCEHGVMPVPAPATAELLRGVPLATCDERHELTTPTGAAILTTLAKSFGPLPAMAVDAIGYGAGTRENRSRPNFLRVLVGEATEAGDEADQVVVLEAQMDDSTGQALAYAIERVLEAGALDAFIVPITMKKGRPGQLLTVLSHPDGVPALEDVILAETTTLGVRRHTCARRKLARERESVTTRFGTVRVKTGQRGDRVVKAWPEFEDCATAAKRCGVALRTVQDAALQEWNKRHGDQPDRRD